MTVNEILATGRYTDRRGRRFGQILDPSPDRGKWLQWWPEIRPYPEELLSPAQMRLLIERDQHRDECRGAWWCIYHPVPMVYKSNCGWEVVMPWSSSLLTDEPMGSMQEAFDAARALAVGE